VYLSVCLSVRVSARCDWLTGDYLRKGRHRPGLRLTSLGGLTKDRLKAQTKAIARGQGIHGQGIHGQGIHGQGNLHNGLIYTSPTKDRPWTGIRFTSPLLIKRKGPKGGGGLFVYLSGCLKVRMSAHCHWSTVST
jgi:hypothetical protein